jgi:excisionase family DNA binding protein
MNNFSRSGAKATNQFGNAGTRDNSGDAPPMDSLRSGRIVTIEELATILKVHPITVYRMVKRGELPAFRIGRVWRLDSEQIDHWLRNRNQ